jgi:hypothetical protein
MTTRTVAVLVDAQSPQIATDRSSGTRSTTPAAAACCTPLGNNGGCTARNAMITVYPSGVTKAVNDDFGGHDLERIGLRC